MTGVSVWINGEPRPPGDAHVSAVDRGVTLGDGVFETMFAQHGSVFRLEQHLLRLSRGLAVLGMPMPDEAGAWVQTAVAQAVGDPLAVRLTVTRGPGPGGLAPPDVLRQTVIVAVTPQTPVAPEVRDAGLSAHVASGRLNEQAMTAGVKTTAYVDAVVALREARRHGADEALFLDTAGHCAEASASNLFLWTRDRLVTPPLTCGVLPGITRAAVLDLASAFGLPAEESVVGLEDLLSAEEAFLTSSLRGIAPLVRVDGRAIGGGVPGVHTRALTGAYLALVERECAAS